MTLFVEVRASLREFTLEATFEAPPGITTILGPSGAGKTTLLRAIAGLVRPERGRVVLGERTLFDAKTFVAPFKRNIGFVFQEYALFPHLDVYDNVAFGLRARRLGRRAVEAQVRPLLERFEIARLAHGRVTELSGGERQRVALARALAPGPAALLLDEPLSALDSATRERTRGELARILAQIAVPTLLVTHDLADQAALGGRTLRMERGRLQPPPTPESRPDEPSMSSH